MQKRIKFSLQILMAIIGVIAMFTIWKMMNTKLTPTVHDYPQIMEDSVLNVVTDYNSVGYYVSGDSVLGFQYEMTRALEKDWKVKVNLFLENSLEKSLDGLASHQYDIVARGIPVNIDLRSKVSFTDKITLNKQVLVQRKAAYNDSIEPIRQHLNLARKTIIVSQNSPAILRLKNLSYEISDTIYIQENPTYEAEQLVMMVASGDINFTVCNKKLAQRMAKRFPELDIETDISFMQLESWAVRQDAPVLLDSLNAWLIRFKQTTQFKKIVEKYY